MYAVTVMFKLAEGRQEEFLGHMMKNARGAVQDEPGCRQFDVCTDPDDPTTVFLYELYDDLAAFEAHQTMPHYKAVGAALAQAEGLVLDKVLRVFPNVHR